MYKLYLKRGEEKRILNGNPWVFANEVQKIEGDGTNGSISEVYSFDGRLIGQGFINHLSKIIVRLLTYDGTKIDKDFFYKKIKTAWETRLDLGFENNCRVVFSESDGLPGLIVDKYGKYLCVQFFTLGMDIRRNLIREILTEIFDPSGIFERSDISVRSKEGLQEVKGFLSSSFDSKVEIIENEIRLLIDLENGQKTGYFLDQKENRAALKNYIKDKSVLDCFCNIGGFSLNAAKGGAKNVTAVDISETAGALLKENAKLNNFSNIAFKCADVFNALRDYRKNGEKFDVVILDPPAFTKTSDKVKEASKGYKDINVNALKIIKPGGYLVSCSCSQHISPAYFLSILNEAAADSGKNIYLTEFRGQSKDHPVLLSLNETSYLKCAILRVENIV